MTERKKELTKVPLGPSGRTVASNVERLMKAQNLTYSAVVTKLADIERPIPLLGLRKIVRGLRRVDADDLVALAVVLGVSPVTLLAPNASEPTDAVEATGISGGLTAKELWKWLRADRPAPPGGEKLTGQDLLAFVAAASPDWRAREYAEGVMQILEPYEANVFVSEELGRWRETLNAERSKMMENLGLRQAADRVNDGDDQ